MSVGTFDYPIALNQSVTITLRKQNEDVLILSLDGHPFVHFQGALNVLTVHASGLKGEITLPASQCRFSRWRSGWLEKQSLR